MQDFMVYDWSYVQIIISCIFCTLHNNFTTLQTQMLKNTADK